MLKEGGAWFLAGSAIKRAEPITLKVLLAHAASIPGGGVCRLFFTEDECRYTEFHIVDQYGAAALQKISAVAPKEKVESALLSLSLKKIAERPFQYIFYMCIEAAKMPFWESTQMGFVIYPPWLENFFGRKSIRFSIRFIPAALTYLAVFSLTVRIFKRRHTIFNSGTKEEESIICFFMLLVIFIFTSLHSPFAVLARYNLPIAPLYIACIAYFLHNKIYLK
jgi:hypothetical protein